MAAATVHVKNIASATSDDEVRNFFSFCGKIADFKVASEGDVKSADVTFEKETAMQTALLLNNTQLGPNHISVTSSRSTTDDEGQHDAKVDRDSDEITQEEKPRARILAEYLAHGYVVGDAAIERAIELDTKHNVSHRFLSTIQSIDQKYHATDRAKAADTSYGISQRANSILTGIGSYFEKASNHPTGKKIVKFYTDSSRQVQDIHAEARRLADLKKQEHGGSAYKAAGLERVFGKEAPKESPKESSPTAAPTATATATSGGAPATTTPAAVAPTEAIPATKPADEKTG
ncbi:Protein vip1 [Metarhizium acridum]|uniref:Vip1 n=1 Tax=Metarhizium acridum (strain CQMa 102) TaxID=655827 RepID=E9E4F3_METAQ|nr:vip1 [Metarhizium acridum CQMa 102]EFY89164.1 vip1 [Metarhizium acridum CQMa 102]KAG8423923.1 Protein vip1 [Metarhizium acridum]